MYCMLRCNKTSVINSIYRFMYIFNLDGAAVTDLTLKTEEGRKSWEEAFSAALISPILAVSLVLFYPESKGLPFMPVCVHVHRNF